MVILVEASGLLFRCYFRQDKLRDGEVDVQEVLDAFYQRLYATERYAHDLQRRLNQYGHTEPPPVFIVVFDSAGNCRRDRVPSYKAQRDTPPQAMLETLKAAQYQAVLLENWHRVVAPEDWEADDVIASIAYQASSEKRRVQIHSIDKDFNQCLVPGLVGIAKPRKAAQSYVKLPKLACELYAARNLVADFGFGPDQWVDFQCLIGDSADNIKGFPGVGNAIAKRWLSEYHGPLELLPLDLMTKKQQAVYQEEFLPQLDDLRFLLTLKTDLEVERLWAL